MPKYATTKSGTFMGRGMTHEEAAVWWQKSKVKVEDCFLLLANFACEFMEDGESRAEPIRVFEWVDEDYGYAIPLTSVEAAAATNPPKGIVILDLEEKDLGEELPFLEEYGFCNEKWYSRWLDTYGGLD